MSYFAKIVIHIPTSNKSDGGGVMIGVARELRVIRKHGWENDDEFLCVVVELQTNFTIKKNCYMCSVHGTSSET